MYLWDWSSVFTALENHSNGPRAITLTLICLFSSRSLWASICSLLHSSMIFFTSPSSRVELIDFGGSAEGSDFSKLDDIILLDSMSCCKWVTGRQVITKYVFSCCYSVSMAILAHYLAGREVTLCVFGDLQTFMYTPVYMHIQGCRNTESLSLSMFVGVFTQGCLS